MLLILLLSQISTLQLFAQNTQSIHLLEVNTRAPYYFGLGYEFQVNGKWSFKARGGHLRAPYDKMLYDLIPFEEDYSNVVSAFEEGWIADLGAAYNYKNNRLAISFQRSKLSAETNSLSTLREMISTDTPELDLLMIAFGPQLEGRVQMQTVLYLFTVGYERIIPFKNPRWELLTGISFNRYLKSEAITTSIDNPLAQEVYRHFDHEVNSSAQEQFQNYLYFPSFDLALRYKFKFPIAAEK